jgi:hypothetical protein
VNSGERARAIQHGEVPGIPSIGFDAIARTARDERGGDDVARNLALLKGALLWVVNGPTSPTHLR